MTESSKVRVYEIPGYSETEQAQRVGEKIAYLNKIADAASPEQRALIASRFHQAAASVRAAYASLCAVDTVGADAAWWLKIEHVDFAHYAQAFNPEGITSENLTKADDWCDPYHGPYSIHAWQHKQ